jgi:signal transduction histidine kinase/ligand-binding sensor domain-containing protein
MPPRDSVRLILLLCLLAAAPTAGRAEQPPVRTYTTAEGLASDTVLGVMADSRGFLWFCTSDGLSRFDGYTFATFTARDGLPDRRVSDVCETHDGSIWVATAKGLCRFDPRGPVGGSLFVPESLGDDPKANEVNVLLETRDGVLLCGTDAGLFRLAEREGMWTVSRVDFGAPASVMTLAEDRWGGVWAGIIGEVRLVRPDGRVEAHPLPGASRAYNVLGVYDDTDGTLWVGTQRGICRSAPRASTDAPVAFYEMVEGAPAGWANAFFESRDGTLWVVTTKGIWRRTVAEGAAFERSAALDFACDREVWDVAEDRDGNLWLATTCGVLRVDRYGFTRYTKADGLAPEVNSIFESNAGELIVTSLRLERVIHRLEGATFASVVPNLPKAGYYGWGWGQTVIQDREGAWWVPSAVGVSRYPKADRPETAVRGRPEPIYTGNEVFRVFEDSRGDVWLSITGQVGLVRWERATGRLVDLTAGTGGSSGDYTAFCEGPDGAVWVGTAEGGLLRYANGRFERFTVADGAPAGWLRDLHFDDAGRLWIASSRGGLARVDDAAAERPSFVAYTMAEGLASDNVWCVVADAWGRVYAGTTRGVDRIDPATGRVKHYTSADGLSKSQPYCAFRDRRGRLWFGSTFGLVRFDPEPEREREPPRTFVTGLRVAGVARPVSALGEATVPEMELGSDENSVSLEFLGLGASLGEELRYQYKLEGGVGDWSPPSAERTVTLANLGPGSYRFLVRAVDADGVVSPEPAEVAFTVATPLWRRWWFLAFAAAFVVLAAYGAYRYRVRRLLEIERVRTRIATDLHDDIGANLSRIAVLSEVARNDRAGNGGGTSDQLASIADISRESVAAMSDIVWAINPKKDSLDDMVSRMRRFAGEAFAARGVDVEFRGPEHERGLRLDHETRRELFLVFKEAVTNAVRHSGCARAEVELRVDGRRLVLAISDDGRGFDPSAPSEGNGLESMRRRAAALGGTLDFDSGAAGVAGVRRTGDRGTHVRVTVPLGASARRRHPVRMDR